MTVAYIFPAFVSEYIGSEIQILNQLSDRFQQNVISASEISGIDFTKFHLENADFMNDELRMQIATYIFSCSLSDELTSRDITPDVLAGYSMGLYAALYTGRSLSFEEGLQLIIQAFNLSKAATENIKVGMGSVIGLTAEEITNMIAANRLSVAVANSNSLHSHLITGYKDDIRDILESARNIGALHASSMNVSTPYHSELLGSTREPFGIFITEKIKLNDSIFPILSSIDQRIIRTPEDIAKELTDNLSKKINWMASFNKMLEFGITDFIECGAGKSLQKISRFQSGDFKVYPISKIENLFNQQ
jgi:[acyl-carrier-protein] S-malonyltransferase